MPLVEIIAGESTAAEEISRAMAFAHHIYRLPLQVKSAPGFLVNRILIPYLLEAVMMVEEGIAPFAVDSAAEDFGMPMGPVHLADTVGLDMCLHAGNVLAAQLEMSVPVLLVEKVKAGYMGKKSGRGFYSYKKGKKIVSKLAASAGPSGDIQERLILRMVNEAMHCLDEGIVEEADLLDAGMIYGTGFAPFRGGVMHYCHTEGIENILNRLKVLEGHFGDRFHPARGWDRLVPEDTSN
jgi:3-hydroxyacyl-CoA dehydrogenase/enoyl-CoA hydratase/3-hydroxybutyryl-CoA epimerase